ncbi:MAG: hypothetical protein GZ091_01360 [Paludibacter sp.]|nr:hypothetical protein [Paludibacter sp.]
MIRLKKKTEKLLRIVSKKTACEENPMQIKASGFHLTESFNTTTALN